MLANLLQDIEKNKFLLVLLEEDNYPKTMDEIIKSVEKTKTMICYICLSKPYTDVVDELRKNGIDTDNFYFMDVLTSHYKKPEPVENCSFLSSPVDLEELRAEVIKAIQGKNCSVVIFDTISTLMIYQQSSSIVKFTHSLVSEKTQENIKKLFLMIKESGIPSDDMSKLTKDLEMFADKKIDLTESQAQTKG